MATEKSKSAEKPADPKVATAEEQEGAESETLSAAEETLERVQAAATDLYKKLSATADQLAVEAERVYESSRGYVKDHPTTTLLGAFGLGMVIGLLLGRDR